MEIHIFALFCFSTILYKSDRIPLNHLIARDKLTFKDYLNNLCQIQQFQEITLIRMLHALI